MKMLRTLCLAVVLGLLGQAASHAQARWPEGSPERVVQRFYADYMRVVETQPRRWVQALMELHSGDVDSDLATWLNEMANNEPGSDKAWLDFDPFSNSQMGTKRFEVRRSALKAGSTWVPVALLLNRERGAAKVRLHVTLRSSGSRWIMTNFVYPPEQGVASWDLKGFLKRELHH